MKNNAGSLIATLGRPTRRRFMVMSGVGSAGLLAAPVLAQSADTITVSQTADAQPAVVMALRAGNSSTKPRWRCRSS